MRLNDEALKRQITDHVIEKMREGDVEAVKVWAPDRSNQDIVAQVAARNILVKTVNWATHEAEIFVLGYLRSLVEGVLSSERHAYMREGATVISHPIYTHSECGTCLEWLRGHMDEVFQRELQEVISTYLDKEDYIPLWEASGEEGNQYTGDMDALEKAFLELKPLEATLLNAWSEHQESPALFSQPEWVKDAPREKLNSIVVTSGGSPHTRRSKQEAFRLLDQAINEQNSTIPAQLEEKITQLQDHLASGVREFNQNHPAAELQSHQRVVGKKTRDIALFICDKIARLKTESVFLAQITELKKHLTMSSYDKVTIFLRGLEPLVGLETSMNEVIPVVTMDELCYHIAFLREHLAKYCREEAEAKLFRKVIVSPDGETSVLDNVKIARQASAISTKVQETVRPWIDALEAMNLAEEMRQKEDGKLIRELLTFLARLKKQLPQANRDGGWSRMKGSVAERAQEAYENLNVATAAAANSENDDRSDRERRREILVEMAPGRPDVGGAGGNRIIQFIELVPLYANSDVSENTLRELCSLGLTNHSDLMRLAVQHADSPVALELSRYFLAQGAKVDNNADRERYVRTEALAYSAVARSRGSEEYTAFSWKLFALLRGAKDLLDSDAQVAWITQSAKDILNVAAEKNQVDRTAYYTRDLELMKLIVRCIVVFVYFDGIPVKSLLVNSPVFRHLTGMWDYLSLSENNPQMLQKLPNADLSNPVKTRELQREVTAKMRNIFSQNGTYKRIRTETDTLIKEKVLPSQDCEDYVREVSKEEVSRLNNQVVMLRGENEELTARMQNMQEDMNNRLEEMQRQIAALIAAGAVPGPPPPAP